MIYNTLGNTDLKISQIGLGTMTYGEQTSKSEAFQQLNYSLDHGINFIDTAELYPVPPRKETYTKTETIIGHWFKNSNNREKCILATKVAGSQPNFDWIREKNDTLIEETITKAVENSLTRLQTDYIDLYQIHWPSRPTNCFGKRGYQKKQDIESVNIETILLALQKSLRDGKIKHYGISNETPWGIMQYLKNSEELSMPAPVSIQNPYNLLNRSFEVGLSEISLNEKIDLLAYSPLAFGLLSGKYLKGNKPSPSRLEIFKDHFKRYNTDNANKAVNQYDNVAKKHNVSLTQMSLAFINQQSFCASNLIGATTLEQLKENIESISLTLTDEMKEDIEAIHSKIPDPCP